MEAESKKATAREIGGSHKKGELEVIMLKDPIVNEIRKAGEQLAREANYDLHTLFENMRDSEKKSKDKVVSKIKYKASSRLNGVVREK